MTDFFIDPEWLEVVRGKKLLYPSAYLDHDEPLAVFQDHIDEFWFCDINYPPNLKMDPALNGHPQFQLIKTETSGAVGAKMEHRTDSTGNHYRNLEPSRLIESYKRNDGRLLIVIRRRGFGQIAITEEFSAGELGVFMHRGDSTGEGGSNVYYLNNLKSRYEPIANLFQKISTRFGNMALVVSDGSLTSIRQIKAYRGNRDFSGREAFEQFQETEFTYGVFRWACVGWIGNNRRPTLVWGLTRQTYK